MVDPWAKRQSPQSQYPQTLFNQKRLPRIIAAEQTLLEGFFAELVDIITEIFDGIMPVHMEKRTKKTWLPGDWQVGCSVVRTLSQSQGSAYVRG